MELSEGGGEERDKLRIIQETDVVTVVPSGRSKGGKDEEVKLSEIILPKCQKSSGKLDFERL
ncbi:hypothetical protein E2C01_042070 [Portunus trituberculatus]|uniref:Uncharacterized protein n=1 Tax=Portunus trituberculatus TaxID=210409 RepID=A0A5B7FP78_PORTR|nr:hypothetical protein [Portunus trituberculatus]